MNLLHDFLVPLATTHKPELIQEAHDLITGEYKLKLLDHIFDEATKAQGVLLWELEIKKRTRMVKRLITELHRLYLEISMFV